MWLLNLIVFFVYFAIITSTGRAVGKLINQALLSYRNGVDAAEEIWMRVGTGLALMLFVTVSTLWIII